MVDPWQRPTRTGALSLGSGFGAVAALVAGRVVPLGTGSGPVLASGLFLLTAGLSVAALGLGVTAKVRRGVPGWWSTVGILLGLLAGGLLLVSSWVVLREI